MMEGGYYFCAVTVLLVTIGSVMLQWIKTYMETKLSYFVFQYPLIWLVVGLCCLAGISFAVPAGLYMLEKVTVNNNKKGRRIYMFERIDYRVIRIDGEYAYLQNWKMKCRRKCVANGTAPSGDSGGLPYCI